jgi:hypothetical protein
MTEGIGVRPPIVRAQQRPLQKALYGMAELFFGRTFRYRGSA